MITEYNTSTKTTDEKSPLIPLSEFIKSGRSPVEMRHLIFFQKKSLVEYGAICKYGRKWLVCEGLLFKWLRENGTKAGRPKRPAEIRGH